MLYYLAVVLYVLVCLAMMLVVYLQQGKGGDIASAFGGGVPIDDTQRFTDRTTDAL